jgi:NTE family protein
VDAGSIFARSCIRRWQTVPQRVIFAMCFGVRWLREMSGIDPSVARDEHGANSREPAPARTGATGLLAAVDIWSTDPAAPAKNPASAIATLPPPMVIEPDHHGESRAAAAAEEPAMRAPASRADQRAWPPRKLSLALQGGGSFAAFSWGVLDRLLEQADCKIDAISGASAGAVNAVLLASGLVEGGRPRARARLQQFWTRIMEDASFRSLMLVGGFSPAGSSVAFGPALRSGQFDPFDLDPLRRLLTRDIDFSVLRDPRCPKLLIAATCVRDGQPRIFRNAEITADVVLASTCPPQVHCTVEIDNEAYWDGGFAANPPVVRLVQESEASHVLVVQVTPACDSYVPITMAAIDRRLDQITANSVLNAEIAALEWARDAAATSGRPLRIFRIAAEDEIEGLAQRSAVDLGLSFVTKLHGSGRDAADRWLKQAPDAGPPTAAPPRREAKAAPPPRALAEAAV